MPAFAPKPPPTAGVARRARARDRGRACRELVAHAVRALRRRRRTCRPPAGSPGTATMPAGSIGTGATRWLTMRRAHHDVGVVEHALDRAGAHRVGDVRALRLVHDGAPSASAASTVDDRAAAGRSRRSPSRPRRPPAPWSRRRPSRRCRRRSAPCPCASGGRFIVGGNMMKPCTVGQIEVGGGVHRDDARHRLRVARVDRPRCSRGRPSTARTRRGAGPATVRSSKYCVVAVEDPGVLLAEDGVARESSPTSAFHSSCAA